MMTFILYLTVHTRYSMLIGIHNIDEALRGEAKTVEQSTSRDEDDVCYFGGKFELI